MTGVRKTANFRALMDSSLWPERRPRHSVALAARVIHRDGRSTPTIITDLSEEGCKITGLFPIGEQVALEADKLGRIEGQIRWSINHEAGVRFTSAAEDQSAFS